MTQVKDKRPEEQAAERFGARIFHVRATREPGVPAGWAVFNAPRPLPGHQTWTGGCMHGSFYSAVDLERADAGRVVPDIVSLDGWALHYVTQAEIDAWAQVFAREERIDLTGCDPDDVRRSYFLHHNHLVQQEGQ
ncbi:MAG TPA: hypothetical protein VET66_06715 [Steroidobacteraceae bacterium]|nr:hypothetical protein [Steroidobacteraceae bacterium]